MRGVWVEFHRSWGSHAELGGERGAHDSDTERPPPTAAATTSAKRPWSTPHPHPMIGPRLTAGWRHLLRVSCHQSHALVQRAYSGRPRPHDVRCSDVVLLVWHHPQLRIANVVVGAVGASGRGAEASLCSRPYAAGLELTISTHNIASHHSSTPTQPHAYAPPSRAPPTVLLRLDPAAASRAPSLQQSGPLHVVCAAAGERAAHACRAHSARARNST